MPGVHDRMSRYGTWIACCLSRGRKAPLDTSDVEVLATEMGEQAFAAGTFVFRRGDRAAKVHVVRSGSVELSRLVNGRRVMLQLLRPGDVFGDVPALLGDPEPFDALLAGGLESQLASLLLRQAGADGIVRLTQGHLAALLGVPRASVQRVLKSLESSELVALRYRRIELVDLTGLVSLSDDSDD